MAEREEALNEAHQQRLANLQEAHSLELAKLKEALYEAHAQEIATLKATRETELQANGVGAEVSVTASDANVSTSASEKSQLEEKVDAKSLFQVLPTSGRLLAERIWNPATELPREMPSVGSC